MVVGDDLIKKARSEVGSLASDLTPFANVGPVHVHGRRNPVYVWKLQTRPGELRLEDRRTHYADAMCTGG